jgi:hypothetical protein
MDGSVPNCTNFLGWKSGCIQGRIIGWPGITTNCVEGCGSVRAKSVGGIGSYDIAFVATTQHIWNATVT